MLSNKSILYSQIWSDFIIRFFSRFVLVMKCLIIFDPFIYSVLHVLCSRVRLWFFYWFSIKSILYSQFWSDLIIRFFSRFVLVMKCLIIFDPFIYSVLHVLCSRVRLWFFYWFSVKSILYSQFWSDLIIRFFSRFVLAMKCLIIFDPFIYSVLHVLCSRVRLWFFYFSAFSCIYFVSENFFLFFL